MAQHAPKVKGAGQLWTADVTRAQSLFQAGRYDQALLAIDAALAKNAEYAPSYYLRGSILAVKQELTLAAESLRWAVRLDGEYDEAWLALAHVLIELHQHEEALAAIDRSLALNEEAVGYRVRGRALAFLDRPEPAIAAYRKALDLDPFQVKARLELGQLLVTTGDTAGALAELRLAQQCNPADLDTRIALGDLLRDIDRPTEAIGEYVSATEFFPMQAAPYQRLGETYFSSGRMIEAASMYRTAILLDGRQMDAYVQLGQLHIEHQQFEQAITILETAIGLDPASDIAARLLESAREGLKIETASWSEAL